MTHYDKLKADTVLRTGDTLTLDRKRYYVSGNYIYNSCGSNREAIEHAIEVAKLGLSVERLAAVVYGHSADRGSWPVTDGTGRFVRLTALARIVQNLLNRRTCAAAKAEIAELERSYPKREAAFRRREARAERAQALRAERERAARKAAQRKLLRKLPVQLRRVHKFLSSNQLAFGCQRFNVFRLMLAVHDVTMTMTDEQVEDLLCGQS